MEQNLFKTGAMCTCGMLLYAALFFGVCRMMPVILPSELLPWMMRCGIWPVTAADRTQQYWKHLRDVGSPVAGMSSGDHVPIYLWGDAAQFTESGQSMMVLACGLVMDDDRSNIFPLFLCREDIQLQ
jgi:hypothetical protein